MELREAMISCGRYTDEDEIDETIEEMKQRVIDGENPEEVLYEEGFELDYIFDIM